MFNKKETSHLILVGIFSTILIAGIVFSYKITFAIQEMATVVYTNMKNTMDPKAPDPGKTKPETLTIPETSKKVVVGTYLERIENLDIKESSWSYEFYLWFKWKSNEVDILGVKDNTHKNELPFTIINGDILKCDVVDHYRDTKNNIEYVQYFVKAKNTQFFDVSLYPIDKHDLIIPIEHKWLDRTQVYFEPDTIDSKVSSRVMINGYEKKSNIKLIEKSHAYKSARGNPKFTSGYKIDFSQYRMAFSIYKGGLSVILKLFLILYVAVFVTFIAPFTTDPSRYTVAALFTTAGANYILASKLPPTNNYSLGEIINAFCVVVILTMMALLAILPAVIYKDGVIDSFEKKMNKIINFTVFFFFLLINTILIYVSINFS
ncbi:MAG: hypothetical protein EBR87_02685 [Cytophagia bacterium]|nr:hypothetical protein [Cytophagia bacterium]